MVESLKEMILISIHYKKPAYHQKAESTLGLSLQYISFARRQIKIVIIIQVKIMKLAIWVEENLTLDPTTYVPFRVIYEKYKHESLKEKILPDSKIQFSRGLRDKLKLYMENGQVSIVNRKGVIVKGVKFK